MADTRPKFTFDTVFDAETIAREERRKKPVGPPLVHTEQALVDAVNRVREETRTQAFAEGRHTGVAEVREAIDVHIARAEEAIARTLPLLADIPQQLALEARKEAVQLGMLVGRKLAGALLARLPQVEVQAMIEKTLVELGQVSKNAQVNVRVPQPLAEPIAAAMRGILQRNALPMKVTVAADPALSGSAVRVEWPEGGADRDPAALEAEVVAAAERYMTLLDDLPEYKGRRDQTDPGVPTGTTDVSKAVEGVAQAAAKSVAETQPAAPVPPPVAPTAVPRAPAGQPNSK